MADSAEQTEGADDAGAPVTSQGASEEEMTTKERSGSCTVTPSTRTAAESPMRDDLVYTLGIDKVLSPSSSSGGIVDIACLESRFIGLLFSSNFAKDDVGKNGQHFIEALADFAVKHIETFAVLYVSLDESAEKMEEFLEGKPFYAVPYDKAPTRRALTEQFGANTSMHPLPSLCILSPECKIVTSWVVEGKSAILWNAEECFGQWAEGKSGITWTNLIGAKYLRLY